MRTILLEPHPILADALSKLCEVALELPVVACARTVNEACFLVRSEAAKALVTKLPCAECSKLMPRPNALDELRIIAFDDYCDLQAQLRARSLGFNGLLRTDAPPEKLRSALATIANGSTHFWDKELDSPIHQRAAACRRFLSDWETKILGLIGLGLSDGEIGPTLGVSPRTAQTHRSNIMRKLGISGTPKLMVFAITHGFTRFPPAPSASSVPGAGTLEASQFLRTESRKTQLA